VVEFTPEADTGFMFVGYTGDCAPGGRTLMSGARTCGATFEALPRDGGPTPGGAIMQTLTINPVPVNGTVESVDIVCGTKGSACSAPYPDGQMAIVKQQADPGYTFIGFIGDCAPTGQMQMAGPRTCSANFVPDAVASAQPTVKVPVVPPKTPPRSTPGSGPGTGSGTPGTPGTTTPGGSPATTGGQGGTSQPSNAQPQTPVTQGDGKAKEVETDEAAAKRLIQGVLNEYCAAYAALDPQRVRQVFPTVDMPTLQIQLNASKYKSVTCKFGEPTFVALNPGGGTAKVRADVTRVYEHTAIKKVDESELIADMTLSRPGDRARWQIDAVSYKTKPKK
jgi:hypothetical protein